jgi:signal transduction histidine kinase
MDAVHRVAAFVMHDLKNCAATLTMVTANAREHLGNPEFQHDALEAISSTADRIRRLIARVSALPSGAAIGVVPVDLARLVREVSREMQPALPSDVVLRLDAQPVPPVYADLGEIRRVVVNLVLNAAEAIPRDGGAIEVATFADGPDACIQVIDTGSGIPQARLKAGLFAPFTSTKPGGLGIGLYQCKAIVDAHAGRIEVRTAPRHGTTFTVRLPAAEPSRVDADAATSNEAETWQSVAPY